MTADTIIVAAAVGLALGFLARLAWRKFAARRANGGCAGGCGCASKIGRS